MAGVLMPKKTRFRKMQRGTMAGRPRGCAGEIVFGEFGLQSLEPAWFTSQQIEAARVSMSRKMKKAGKLIMRTYPDKAVSKKPAETRMGKGKGAPEKWVAVVKRDCVLFEISGVDENTAREIFAAARYKLPMKVRFIKKEKASERVL